MQLDGGIVWNAHNTVFGWKRSAICAQAVYFLHSTMPSVTCLQKSDVSVICRVTYFQFQKAVDEFLRCWKGAPYGKIFKILFIKFSPLHRSTLLCSNVVKFCRRKISEIVRYLPDQKIRLPLKVLLLCRSRPKCARANPQQCT